MTTSASANRTAQSGAMTTSRLRRASGNKHCEKCLRTQQPRLAQQQQDLGRRRRVKAVEPCTTLHDAPTTHGRGVVCVSVPSAWFAAVSAPVGGMGVRRGGRWALGHGGTRHGGEKAGGGRHNTCGEGADAGRFVGNGERVVGKTA